MNSKSNENIKLNLKAQMFFPRTYRSFKPDVKQRVFFILICIVPTIILFLLFYPEITMKMTDIAAFCLTALSPDINVYVDTSHLLPLLGGVKYLEISSTFPSFEFAVINFIVTLFLIAFCLSGKRKGRPIAIFFTISLLIHLVSCIYFIFAPEEFPYSTTQYSELYMRLQIAIWFCMILLAGFITGFISYGHLRTRVYTFYIIIAYSLVFGLVRYTAFMIGVYFGSSIYMAIMFFTLGPFFDFQYLVYYYSRYTEKVIKQVGRGSAEEVWEWY